jgi:hypothetical protein
MGSSAISGEAVIRVAVASDGWRNQMPGGAARMMIRQSAGFSQPREKWVWRSAMAQSAL